MSSERLSTGFVIRVAIANVGSEASAPGSIEVYVIDPDQQTELGRGSIEMEPIGAGDRVEKQVTVRARTTSGQSSPVDPPSALP